MAVRLHMGTRAFERYIKGIYFEGPVLAADLPTEISGLLQRALAWCG